MEKSGIWTSSMWHFGKIKKKSFLLDFSLHPVLPSLSICLCCPSFKRYSLFLYLHSVGWPCDLLWPIGCGSNDISEVLCLSFKSPCSFCSHFLPFWGHWGSPRHSPCGERDLRIVGTILQMCEWSHLGQPSPSRTPWSLQAYQGPQARPAEAI